MVLRLTHSRRGASVPVVSLVVIALGIGSPTTAQERGRTSIPDASLDSIRRRLEVITPRSGPPGTVVALQTGGMPALTPLRIGIGATRFGFEEIGQVMTDERGEFTLDVAVPAWVRSDVTYRFIVFDFYFAPIALSDGFHATGPDGTVRREGRLTDEGVECPAFRGDDGILYTLAGDLRGFTAGDRVVIEGTIAEESFCMQGTTMEVVRIRSGEGHP